MALRSWAVCIAFVFGLSQCASSADAGEDSEDSIVGGSPDSDGGAVVALRIGKGARAELCSATAIAPNVLLTARHCVSKALQTTIICNSKGESENGPHFGEDYPVEELRVFTGTKPDFSGEVAAGVREIFHPDGDVVCNQDIALLVLSKDLEGVTPIPVRLTRQVGLSETIRSIGYGKTDSGSTGTRLRKTGVTVRAIGPGLSASETALGEHEFEVGMSICHGDSGGPAISQSSGAVIGVVSRGGDCSEDFGHVYTSTTGFGPLIEKAIAAAGAPPPQLEPDVPIQTAKPAAAPKSGGGANEGGCSIGLAPVSHTKNGLVGGIMVALGLGALIGRRPRVASRRG